MAQCKDCLQARAVDEFADAQWECIRANRPGTCLSCTKDGKGVLRRKILSGTDKYKCVSCGFIKIEDAFPRAQLRQEDAASKQKCLACVRQLQWLICDVCKTEKAALSYSPSMLTYPTGLVACCDCQKIAQNTTDYSDRKGWMTCKHCHELMRSTRAATQLQYCLNCSNRTTHVRDQHTCRSCGTRWVERQTDVKK
eukprot:6481159-Amphidinium_carterae.1